MIPRRRAALAMDHAPHLLPLLFAAALLGGLAIQARLMPSRPIPMDIPSTAGVAPGAAPQESVAPEWPVSATIVSPSLLPSESRPSDPPVSSRGASSGGPAFVTDRPSAVWTDLLPRETGPEGASGNVKVRSRQPTMISLLVASIMQSLKRLHTFAQPAKAAAATQARIKAGRNRPSLGTSAPKPGLAGWGLGGPVPQRAALGGPAPVTARYAPIINGMRLQRP